MEQSLHFNWNSSLNELFVFEEALIDNHNL